MRTLILIVILSMSFAVDAKYKGSNPIVQPKQLLENLNDYLIVDVRSEKEFAQGHIKTAVNYPYDSINQFLDSLLKVNKPIVVYCRSGRRAWVAEQEMAKAGVKNIKHLAGDMIEWQQKKLPLVSED